MSVENTAALLSAVVFSSADLLGVDSPVFRRRVLASGVPTGAGSRSTHHLASQVRQLGGSGTTGPALAHEIGELLLEHDRKPLRILRAAQGCSVYKVGHVFPADIFLFDSTLQDGIRSSGLPILECTDSHLHSGASVSLSSLMDAAFVGPLDESILEAVAVDLRGSFFRPGILIAAARAYLAHFDRDSARFELGDVSVLIRQGGFWAKVCEMAVLDVDGEGAEEADDFARNLLAWPRGESLSVSVPMAIRNLLWADSASLTAKELRAFESGLNGLVSSLFLACRFLRSSPGEGLSSFVQRFEEVSRFADAFFGGIHGVERRVEIADRVRIALPDSSVLGAELRKSIVPASIRVSSERVRAALVDHCDGFALAACQFDKERRLSVPLTFLRRSARAASGSLELRSSMADQWIVAASFAQALEVGDAIVDAVGAIDVVGDEIAQENWIFVPLLRFLSNAFPKLAISCHAGESFRYPLQGIRSVGELIDDEWAVDRIGHALALDTLCADFIAGSGRPRLTRFDMLNDLLWVKSLGIFERETEALLDRLLYEASLDELGVTADDLMVAWKLRRSIEGFRDLGLSGSNPSEGVGPFGSLVPGRGGVGLAFAVLTHIGGPLLGGVDREPSVELGNSFLGWSEAARKPCVSWVGNEIGKREIILESCPTSNLRLSGLVRARYLPTARWANSGFRVSVSSDDPVIFGTDVRNELDLLQNAFGPELATKVAATSLESCVGAPRSTAGFREQSSEIRRLFGMDEVDWS